MKTEKKESVESKKILNKYFRINTIFLILVIFLLMLNSIYSLRTNKIVVINNKRKSYNNRNRNESDFLIKEDSFSSICKNIQKILIAFQEPGLKLYSDIYTTKFNLLGNSFFKDSEYNNRNKKDNSNDIYNIPTELLLLESFYCRRYFKPTATVNCEIKQTVIDIVLNNINSCYLKYKSIINFNDDYDDNNINNTDPFLNCEEYDFQSRKIKSYRKFCLKAYQKTLSINKNINSIYDVSYSYIPKEDLESCFIFLSNYNECIEYSNILNPLIKNDYCLKNINIKKFCSYNTRLFNAHEKKLCEDYILPVFSSNYYDFKANKQSYLIEKQIDNKSSNNNDNDTNYDMAVSSFTYSKEKYNFNVLNDSYCNDFKTKINQRFLIEISELINTYKSNQLKIKEIAGINNNNSLYLKLNSLKSNINKLLSNWKEFYPSFYVYFYLFNESSVIKTMRDLFDQWFSIKKDIDIMTYSYKDLVYNDKNDYNSITNSTLLIDLVIKSNIDIQQVEDSLKNNIDKILVLLSDINSCVCNGNDMISKEKTKSSSSRFNTEQLGMRNDKINEYSFKQKQNKDDSNYSILHNIENRNITESGNNTLQYKLFNTTIPSNAFIDDTDTDDKDTDDNRKDSNNIKSNKTSNIKLKIKISTINDHIITNTTNHTSNIKKKLIGNNIDNYKTNTPNSKAINNTIDNILVLNETNKTSTSSFIITANTTTSTTNNSLASVLSNSLNSEKMKVTEQELIQNKNITLSRLEIISFHNEFIFMIKELEKNINFITSTYAKNKEKGSELDSGLVSLNSEIKKKISIYKLWLLKYQESIEIKELIEILELTKHK